MFTQDEWKKLLDDVNRRYIEHNNLIHCDICGDYHEADNVPMSCQTGDGE